MTLAEQEEKCLFYAFTMTNNVNLNFNVNTKKFKTTGWKTAKDHGIKLDAISSEVKGSGVEAF